MTDTQGATGLVARLNALQPWALAGLRIIMGLAFLPHGTMKLFGFPGGNHPNVPLLSLVGIAGIIEVAAGVLLVVGFQTRLIAFIASGEMAFAYFLRHAPKGFWPDNNGGEPAVLFCFVFLYLVFAGAGKLALDKR